MHAPGSSLQQLDYDAAVPAIRIQTKIEFFMAYKNLYLFPDFLISRSRIFYIKKPQYWYRPKPNAIWMKILCGRLS